MTDVPLKARTGASSRITWFGQLTRSEWIKFRATRSTYLTLLAAVVVAIGVGVLIAQSVTARWPSMDPTQRAGFDPLNLPFRGFLFAQLVMGSLGVLMISSEYACGLIRSTFTAAPQRRAVLMAKTLVIGTVALLIGEATSFATFFVTQAQFHSTGVSLAISSPGALRAVSALGLYMAVVALLGLALGALLRHTAGGISALFALVFLVTDVVNGLPTPWDTRIGQWLPSNLISQIIAQHPDPAMLSRADSLVVLLVYPLVFLTAAAWRLAHTDA